MWCSFCFFLGPALAVVLGLPAVGGGAERDLGGLVVLICSIFGDYPGCGARFVYLWGWRRGPPSGGCDGRFALARWCTECTHVRMHRRPCPAVSRLTCRLLVRGRESPTDLGSNASSNKVGSLEAAPPCSFPGMADSYGSVRPPVTTTPYVARAQPAMSA